MRYRTRVIGILIMLVCITFGGMLPKLVFSPALDGGMGEVQDYAVTPVELGGTNSVIDAMWCSYYGGYSFSYSEEMANLTRDQVIAACDEYLTICSGSDAGAGDQPIRIDREHTDISCEMRIPDSEMYLQQKLYWEMYEQVEATSTDDGSDSFTATEILEKSTISTVLWNVETEWKPGCFLLLCVDDRNQKVVRVNVYSEKYDTSSEKNRENLRLLSQEILPAWESYYGVEVEFLEDQANSFLVRIFDRDGDEIIMRLEFRQGFLNMEIL